ncbi:hypothetical protein [Mangrovimonas aestuarii]|uniref:hypothetical protein n=1 Tax=Mangrovimonas aestuarii TaxID=3018443 RepID=UPI002377F0E6|nr:hypothetical protein [Mangrovimonas aestuarii]
MKHLLVFLFSLSVLSAYAQIEFKTGSIQLDTDLNTINTEANVDFGIFKADMALTYNISERKIESMRTKLQMNAGDIYIALEIAKLSKRPIDEVLDVYRINKTKGWGYIAKQVGIKPGSPEFHALKNNASSKSKKHRSKGNAQAKGKDNKGKSKQRA